MQAHGELRLRWLGNILRAEAQGMFNEEGSLAGIERHRACVLAAGKPHWAQLEIWGQEALGTPEVFAHVAQAYQWSLAQGCCAVAIVASNSIQEGIAEGLVPEPFQLFADEVQALEWLQQQLHLQAAACA